MLLRVHAVLARVVLQAGHTHSSTAMSLGPTCQVEFDVTFWPPSDSSGTTGPWTVGLSIRGKKTTSDGPSTWPSRSGPLVDPPRGRPGYGPEPSRSQRHDSSFRLGPTGVWGHTPPEDGSETCRTHGKSKEHEARQAVCLFWTSNLESSWIIHQKATPRHRFVKANVSCKQDNSFQLCRDRTTS